MILYSLIIAFAMYSKIPMPHVEWSEKNMRFSLCFFPLVGAAVGILVYLWIRACGIFAVGDTARACILAAIPLVVTGGIHADGFVDTMDAVHSWQNREKKLEILKDSHIGAFAVIMLVLYSLIQVAAFSEIDFANERTPFLFAFVFIYSRALAGCALVFGKSARKEGLAYTFAKAGDLRAVRAVMILWVFVCAATFVFLDVRFGTCMAAAGLLCLVRFLIHSKKEFGGLTGDLCGCFIMMTELLCSLVLWIASAQ